ncbi:hypothetical protein, partial [Fulvimarina sp. MAC8]|uniref:hypothetical protein n=1 Tax=Fulvimarina sp. MAC8 TaxID=3162874 RepID=UPI0032EABE94
PNSAVKRASAYDTSSQDAGKSVAARSAKRRTKNLLHNNNNNKTQNKRKPRRKNGRGFYAFGGRGNASPGG